MKMPVPALVEPIRPPRRLRRIVHLECAVSPDIQVARVTGRDKLPLLMESVYGPYLAETVAARAMLVGQALRSVEMLRVRRPRTNWTMSAVLDAIMS
jgi:hypothetical protein